MSDSFFSSFRDPAGSILRHNNRIYRFIKPSFDQEFHEFMTSTTLINYLKKNIISSFKIISFQEQVKLSQEKAFQQIKNTLNALTVLEHEVIDFPSYPYEWCSKQLFEAALLTLELFDNFLTEDIGLKDATPYNILYDTYKPVFVDLLSFEKRNPHDPLWLGYSQFVTTFLLPLYLYKFKKVPINQIFLSNINGLEMENCSNHINYFRPISYSLILIPKFLSRFTKQKHYKSNNIKNPFLAKFILQRLLKSTRKKLLSLKPKQEKSNWSEYMNHLTHYEKSDFLIKKEFISKVLEITQPKKVLDIGCNTGYFSIMAAKKCEKVIALDIDPVVINQLFEKSCKEKLNILPLVVNISNPTPSFGWKNQEYSSFLDRITNYPDLIFMLAVIHHMQVTQRISLYEIAHLAYTITKEGLIIEYVDPKDPMFKKLSRGRDHLHSDLNLNQFKQTFKRFFNILSEEKINQTRQLFYMKKK